jgi:hypothetical protein
MKRFDAADILTGAGFVIVLVGLWWLLPAAAMIIGGLGLMALGLLVAGRRARTEEP